MSQSPSSVSVKKAKTAASYLQTYVTHRRELWGALMRDSAVAKGQNAHNAAYAVWDVAMWLYNVGGDMFASIEIPGDFASGNDFNDKVADYDAKLAESETKLKKEIVQSGSAQPNLRQVLGEIVDMRTAIAQAQKMIQPTLTPAPETSVENVGAFKIIEQIATRFPAVAQRLRKRRLPDEAILMKNEYDVQYVFQGLLEVQFDDVRAEEPGRSVAGGSQRADCYLIDEKTVIEFKRVRTKQTSAEVRKELADDFLLYGKEERFEHLFSFIYDPERVLNKVSFEKDLQAEVTGLKTVRIFVSQ